MGITRLKADPDHEDDRRPPPDMPNMAEFLDYLEADRQSLIIRLRAIDRVLVQHGRLRAYTLPKRIK